jgi:hypothetical protein
VVVDAALDYDGLHNWLQELGFVRQAPGEQQQQQLQQQQQQQQQQQRRQQQGSSCATHSSAGCSSSLVAPLCSPCY